MPTKLKSLKLTSVSLVDQGANQRAEINLKKRKDPNAPKEGFLKRLLDFVKKSGYKQEDVETKLDDIEKSRFTDEIKNQEKSEDGYECGGQIDSFIEAIRFAILSDLFDDSLSPNQRGQSITSSINDFADTALKACESWKNGKPADVSVDIEKMTEPITDESVLKAIIKARDGLSSVIDKSTHEVTTKAQEGPEMQKGADDMKIDKSKLTEAERAFLDSIEKRYGSDDQPATVEETKPEGVEKSLVAIPSEDPKNQPKNAYKDLSPEVQKEIEELKKYKEAAEDRELHDVAKRYEILGKKDEDLFPVLKSLKAASKDAYDQFIAGLDSAKEPVEKSGIFDEIGKSGTGTMPSTSIAKSQAEGKIDNIAKGYIEKGPC